MNWAKAVLCLQFCFVIFSLYSESDIHMSKTYSISINKSYNNSEYSYELEQIYDYTYINKEGLDTKTFSYFEDSDGKLKHTSFSINGFSTYPTRYWEYYNNGSSFLSDQKIHYVKLVNDQKIGNTFSIKQYYEYNSIKLLSPINIPRNDGLKKFKIEIKYPKNLNVKITPIFNADSLSYEVKQKKEYISIVFDSLNFIKDVDYLNDSSTFAYLKIEVSENSKILNPQQTSDIISNYLEKFPDYGKDLNQYIDVLMNESERNPSISDSLKVVSKGSGGSTIIKRSLIELINTTQKMERDEDKVKAIYQFVQKNIRYISKSDSIYTIYPHRPSEVLKNGYGDCKDFSYLIQSLAKYFNINVDLALLNTHYIPKAEALSLDSFNHMIAVYQSQEQNYFLDATDQYSTYGAVPRDFFNLPYLVIRMDQNGFRYFPQVKGKSAMNISIQCGEEAPYSGKAIIELRNTLRSSFLYNQVSMDDISSNNFLSEITSSNFAQISFKNFKKSTINDSVVIVECDADMSKFFIHSDTKTYIKKQAFVISNELLKRKNDQCSVFLGDTMDINLDVILPNKFTLFEDQTDILNDKNLYYHSKLVHQDNKSCLSYRIQVQPMNYQGGEKDALISLIEKLINQKKDMYIIKKGV